MSLLVAAIFCFAALLVTMGAGVHSSPAPSNDPYVETVQAMIDDGMFRLAASGDSLRVAPRDMDAAAKIARVEWLQADMANLSLWTVEGGRIKKFTGAHRVARPFDAGGTWRGQLRYARRLGSAAEIVLGSDQAAYPPLLLSDAIERPAGDAVLPLRPSGQTVTGPAIRIACTKDERDFVRLSLLAQQPVVDARNSIGCTTEVGKRRLAADCSARDIAPDACQFAALEPGQTLRIVRGDGETLSYHLRPLTSTSNILDRTLGGGTILNRDLGTFVALVRTDLEVALQGCRRARFTIGCDDSLILSFDQEVQREVAAALTDHFRSERPHLAAVAVMNAKSGEVMGLGANAPPDQRVQAACPNPALCLLPIGSAAKPMFASAALSADPELATLRIASTPSLAHAILGLPVGEMKNHGADDVDFTDFLRRSDNYYGASLMLLASPAADGNCAMPRAAENRFWINGRPFDSVRSRSEFESQPNPTRGGRCGNRRPAAFRPGWAVQIGRLFEVNPWGPGAVRDPCGSARSFGDDFHDASPWSDLFQKGANRCAMPRSSPRRAWFNIQSVKEFRGELVPVLLGNGNGRWTIVKLAEAYSRIVTGTEVRSTFLMRPRSGGFAPLAGFSDVQRAVSSGLAEVLHQRAGKAGTASTSLVPAAVGRIQRDLPPQYVLGAFAKTGTMEVPPASFHSCPPGLKHDKCFGNSFIIVLAVYDRSARGLEIDPATGLASAAILGPRCAITVAVNLPAWHANGRSATGLAASLIGGAVGRRLLEPACAPQS